MGAWGYEPWEDDNGADWFNRVFKDVDLHKHIKSAFAYCDNYGEIRAACYLLASLGRSSIWPGNINDLVPLLQEAIEILQGLIDPNNENEDIDFLEVYDEAPEVIESVNRQINELQNRLKELGEDRIGSARNQWLNQ